MEGKDFETAMIPFAVHEAQMARNAKQMKLMTIAMCFMALMLFLMAITLVYGYEEEVTTTTTTTEERGRTTTAQTLVTEAWLMREAVI